MNIRAFLDRNYNLLFNRKKCVKIIFYTDWFKYNDIITNYYTDLRCLGKDWYKNKNLDN